MRGPPAPHPQGLGEPHQDAHRSAPPGWGPRWPRQRQAGRPPGDSVGRPCGYSGTCSAGQRSTPRRKTGPGVCSADGGRSVLATEALDCGRQPPGPWAPRRGLALPGPTSGPSSATCWPPCPKPTPPPAPAPPPSSSTTQPSAILPFTHDMPFPWATYTLPFQPHLHSLKCPCWPSYTPTVVCARARGASNVRTYYQRQGAQLGGGEGSCIPALVGFRRHVSRVLN